VLQKPLPNDMLKVIRRGAAAAQEYEAATLHTISVIGQEDNQSQILAFLRWGVAVAALNGLEKAEHNQARFFLTDSGKLNSEMPEFISAAVYHCSKEGDRWGANGRPAPC